VRVRFRNGEVQRIDNIPRNLDSGQTTSWLFIDSGERRCVTNITIKGDTRDFSRREAVIEVWGR
jgi:hypothetical protein